MAVVLFPLKQGEKDTKISIEGEDLDPNGLNDFLGSL